MNSDLNEVLELTVRADIARAAAAEAAAHQLGGVTDYVPCENEPDLRLFTCHRDEIDETGVSLVERVQMEPLTVWVDPPLDLTDAVIARLNTEYAATYGADDKADPMLVRPLSELAARLPKLRDAAAAATPPAAAPAASAGRAPSCGVVDLQALLTGLDAARHYSAALARRVDALSGIEKTALEQEKITEQRYQALVGKPQASEADIEAALAEWTKVNDLVRDRNVAQRVLEAEVARGSRKLLGDIRAQIAAQAAQHHLVRVVLLAGPPEANLTLKDAVGAEVPLDGEGPPVDLTTAVLAALTAAPPTPSATSAAGVAAAGDPFETGLTAAELVRQLDAERRERQARQTETDRDINATWRLYQKEVLHQLPRAASEPAPASTPAP